MKKGYYGKELILDLHDCDPIMFSRESIQQYFVEICDLIDMKRCELHFWDDLETPEDEKQTSPHTIGTSAVQFILTSNITIHTLDLLKAVYLNIFSCKDFDAEIATDFSKSWFKGVVMNSNVINRQ
jgi:S-adenosylmethionine/arginine decarboxylase-like enzyme